MRFASMLIPSLVACASASAQSNLVEAIRDVYTNRETLHLSGTITVSYDMAGQKQQSTRRFVADVVSPGVFIHTLLEKSPELVVGSDGTTAYAFNPVAKTYITAEPLEGRSDVAKLPSAIGPLLLQQNPSLVMALAVDPIAVIAGDVSKIETIAATTLRSTGDNVTSEYVFDAKTNLLSKVTFDLREQMKSQNIPAVNEARITIAYDADAVAAERVEVAWTPPRDAKDLTKATGEMLAGDPSSLVGNPAPAFELKNLAGAATVIPKGKVVVLDFFATWCPPCREGLPHLDRLAAGYKDKGVEVLVVNVQEEPTKVQAFMTKAGLSLNVVFDRDGNVSKQYGVQGIPQSVVIDKQGNVAAVIVGLDPQGVEAAVEAALVK